MKLKVAQRGSVTVIELEGSLLGGPDASDLNSKLHELIDAGKNHVVIDLGKVQFINSSGLGLLIGGLSTVKNAGGELKIANAPQKIIELFKVTKLTSLIDSYSSVPAAVDSFKK